jgi:hypothetical protein
MRIKRYTRGLAHTFAETGGEKPHKMKSPQPPFLTTGLERDRERLKSLDVVRQ